jgi:translocation and assembly module TamB
MSADTVTPPPVKPPAQPAAVPAPGSRRRRWLKRLLPLPTFLVLGVWFAPAIVAKTELRNRFARQALADLHGSVHVGSASLGWFTPVELRDVTIRDEAGRAVVSVPKVTSQKSLFALARNQSEPGEFTLEKPTIAVVCEKNTTNLETAFAEYLKDDGKPPAPTRTPVALRVTGGTLTLTDIEGGTKSVEDINAAVSVPATRAEPITVKVTAATGKLDAELSLGDSGSGKFVSSGLPLDTFGPLLKRFDPGVTLAGAVSADMRVTWGKDAAGRLTLSATGTVGAKQLAVGGPALGGDTLQLDSANLPLDVELAGRVVRVRKFDLACDVGTLSVAGTLDPDEPAEKVLSRAGLVIGADVELAKLAAKLPKLLRVRDGTELREGKLKLDLASKPDGAGAVWEGKVRTSAIKAVRDGKPIAWDEPLNVEFVGRYASGAFPTFDKLICTSDFLAVNARTTPDTVQAAATVYLHQLGAKLAEFIDLGGVALGGEATAQLVGKREPDGAFRAAGVVELKEFAFTDRAGNGLKEPALKLQLSAGGKAPAGGPVQLATATVALTAGGDELHLTLLEPIADVRQLSSGFVDVRISGDVARWKARAAAFTKIPAYQMSGTLVASGKARLAPERITVDRLTVGLTNVKFRGAGIVLDEPTMNAVGDFTLTRASNSASITKMTLNSAPLSVTDGTLAFESQANGAVFVTGNGKCVADLNRLGAVVKLYTDVNGADALRGRGVGPLRFRAAGDVTSFGGALDVTNFAYGPKAQPLWTEPALKLEADGDYRDSTDTVALAVAKVSRPGLDLDAKGSVGKATTTQDVNFTGTVRYDWAKLSPMFREALGASFAATGSGSRAISVSGQLAPPGAVVAALPPPKSGGPIELKAPGAPAPKAQAPAGPSMFAALSGDAAIGWDSIKAYGFDVGAGELKGKMTRGVVAVAPISATFGGGKVTLAPTLKLDTAPGEITLAKGALVERAKLTPSATAGALGYALPAIANAGQAEGEISAVIDENRIALGDFTQSSLKGALVIHKATVGASPVVAEVAKLLGAKNTTMTLATETIVLVQVANGRVHHQNFAINLAGTTIRTSGSVGFDNTLDLVVEVPLPKELPALKNNPVLVKAVAGKTVKLPVKGTLAKPELDPKAFEQAVAALAREAAKDVGKDLIESELKKLFPGMPGPGSGTMPKLPFPLPIGKKP